MKTEALLKRHVENFELMLRSECFAGEFTICHNLKSSDFLEPNISKIPLLRFARSVQPYDLDK